MASVHKHARVTGDKLDEIGLPADAGLFEETAEMCFDGGIGHPEISGNLPHTTNIDDGTKHAKLGRRELVSLADHFGRRLGLELGLAHKKGGDCI